MKLIATILAICLTTVNMFRYNLPEYLNNISVFDTLSLVALAIACIIAISPKKNVLTEGLLLYNILGCLDSIIDELYFDPVERSKGDFIIMVATILFCSGYIIYRIGINKKKLF